MSRQDRPNDANRATSVKRHKEAAARSGSKPDRLDELLAVSPALRAVRTSMRTGKDRALVYPSMADRQILREVPSELKTNLLGLIDKSELKGIGIQVISDPSWHSAGDNAQVKVPAIAKRFNRLKKDVPNLVSSIVPVCVPAEGSRDSFIMAPALAIVAFATTSDDCEPRLGERSSWRDLAGVNGSEHLWIPDPTVADVERVMEVLDGAPSFLRSDASRRATVLAVTDWTSSRERRLLAVFAVNVQLPAKKGFLGAGQGETLLQRALAAGNARSRAAKKSPDSISREKLRELLWSDAMENSRDKPVFVQV